MMLFFLLTVLEIAVHMSFSVGAFLIMFGRKRKNVYKDLVWWFGLLLIFILEIYQEYCAVISLNATWFHAFLEGLWLVGYGNGKCDLAVIWCLFVGYTDMLLNMPALILEAIQTEGDLALVIQSQSLRETVRTLIVFTAVFWACGCYRKKLLSYIQVSLLSVKWIFLLFALAEYVLSFFLMRFIYFAAEWADLMLSGFIILCIGLGLIMLSLYIQFRSLERERVTYLSREQTLRRYYEKTREEQDKLRSLSHDYKYVMKYLYECLQKNDYESAASCVQQQIDIYQKRKGGVWTGHACIDSLIEGGKERGESFGISFSVDADVTVLPVADYDLFMILGNLLDNAFEAAEKCVPGKRYVKIRLKSVGNMFFMYMENSYEEEPLKKKDRFLSTKGKEGHGYGIGNVREIVEKNEGSIKMMFSDHVFKVELMFGGKISGLTPKHTEEILL